MTKIIDRNGNGAALSEAEFDANYDSLSGIVEAQTGTTYTVTIDDQNRTIEFDNASPVAVTLTDIATIDGSLHTTSFKVTFKNIGAGAVTVTCGGADTFEAGGTTLVLAQYDAATIQFDSAETAWNVISEYIVDMATKTGTETLTNKTLTSPVIDAIYDSNGNVMLNFSVAASADNYPQIANSTGDCTYTVQGADTDITMILQGKGAGVVKVNDALNVVGAATLDSTLSVAGDLTVSGTVSGDLTVSGDVAASTITKASVSVYGYVPLDDMVLLAIRTNTVTWTQVDMSTVYAAAATAGAKIAKLWIRLLVTVASGTNKLELRKRGTTPSNPPYIEDANLTGGGYRHYMVIDLPLDSNSDFDYQFTNNGVSTGEMYLLGYYV